MFIIQSAILALEIFIKQIAENCLLYIKKQENDGGIYMKTDARVRYTKMVIKNSFVKLLESKPLTKITVKEICDLSEINRATFYKYYCDPYDLLETIENEFLEELQNNVSQSIHKGFKETFTDILISIKADSKLYQTLFSENGDPHFPSLIFSSCYKNFIIMDKNKEFQKLKPTEQKWFFYFMAQGCSGILSQWIEDKMNEPISKVADFADQLIQKTLKLL